MGLLDAYSGSLETAATGPQRAPGPPDPPGVFHNFWSSAGNYYMRGMAEAGRAVSMAAGAVPAVADKLIGGDNTGEKFADRYFRWHDQTFGSAVDYWTPKPEDVGAAGQVVGSLAAGITQFLASPSLMVGTSQLSTAEDLVRKGVSADAAMVAGDIAGLANVAGIALPIFGKNLAQRMATGAVGNLATNIPQAAITQQIVKADGKPQLAGEFDPWDVRARTVDVLLGAVFGAKAHVDARISDALMASNAARHIEEASLPVAGRTDADVTKAVDSTRLAVEQMSRGEPVDVPRVEVRDTAPVDAYGSEMSKLVDENSPAKGEPFKTPDMLATAKPEPVEGQPKSDVPQFPESVRLPTGEFDPATGMPKTAPASEVIARAQADAADLKTRAADFMRVAATCLLGGV